ncbi:sulfatase [Kribbella turkmenica]|uniref:Sulfatase n=1 Tax=Kribbella turkmenica TaxID=2530375 RepID=A0A4V2YDE3_9ACTN|nr:sulfatase-like hydrolase/transferase [Kribbella turkmenica]TDD14976.1 sulfatase [Kribbella turkmenica]
MTNIVLLMTDQQREGFTAAGGFGLDTMPFCDQLAADGTTFHNGYTPTPACVPARTSLLTGRYPSAHRVRQNSAADEVFRTTDLVDMLRSAGHQTMFIGKPHMYRREGDFDQWSGPYYHEDGPRRGPDDAAFSDWLKSIDHGPATEPTPFPLEAQFPHRIVSDAIEAIDKRDQDRPFFCWLSFPEPHNPYQVPEPYFSMFPPESVPDRACGPEAAERKGGDYLWMRRLVESKRAGYDDLWRRYRASYCGMLRLLDDQVRRFYEHLDAAGLTEDTIFVYLADHGDYVGDYGLQRKGAGMPEVLMRIPFFVTGAGIRQHIDSASFVSLVDLFPTLCEALGQPIPYGVTGRSLWPLLTGSGDTAGEFASVYGEAGFGGVPYDVEERPPLHFDYPGTKYDELNSVTQSGVSRMLRRGDWKLLYDVLGRGELYDLRSDPMELENLWSDPAYELVRSRMVEELLWWTLRITDDLPEARYLPKRAEHNWYARLRHDDGTRPWSPQSASSPVQTGEQP